MEKMKKYYVIYQPFGLGDSKQVSFYSVFYIDGNLLESWSSKINETYFFENEIAAMSKFDEYKGYLPVIVKELTFDCNM